jgi:hypothetical protein
MYHYRLILEDGVYHYLNGDSAAQVKKKFHKDYPNLPKVVRTKRMGVVGV